MYKVVKRKQLTPSSFMMRVHAPNVSKNCEPGQFIICRTREDSERIPLTIADYDREKETVDIVVQAIGASTNEMSELNEGDYFNDFVGPLGNPSDLIEKSIDELKKMNILFIAGGVGSAPVYPQVKWLHDHGVDCDVILGARTKDLLTYEDDLREVATNLYVCTDDGSYGETGNVTVVLRRLVAEGKKYDHAVAIGPLIMMKFAVLTCKELDIPVIVSMNSIMVDGTGMCGACRLTVGSEMKFACVDGPEFDGTLVDWDEALSRQNIYKNEEMAIINREEYRKTHKCSCGGSC